MVLDYGMFFSKKTTICFLGDFMAVGRRTTVRLLRLRPELDSNHLLLHGNSEASVKTEKSYLARIAKNPQHILKLKGSPKTNLKLYVMAMSRGRYSPNIVGTKRQEIVKRMVLRDENVWNKIAKTDIELLWKLRAAFDLRSGTPLKNTSAENETVMFLEGFSSTSDLYDQKKVCEALRSAEYREASRMLMIHSDFCARRNTGGAEMIAWEYQRMVEGVVHGGLAACSISHPFYKEVELYNNFVACREDLSTFNRKLLDMDVYHSLGERGIRDCIASSVEIYDAMSSK
jgi:hypothetical protein